MPVPPSQPFFSWADFDDWKARVLRLLKRKHSRIHDIVDRGCLPIFSLKSNRWFGITASLAYKYYRVPKDVAKKHRNRQTLTDLLESGKHMTMVMGEQSQLCYGHHGGPFLVLLREGLTVDSGEPHKYLYINNVYPRTQEKWKWLSGGDLLFASGVLFALTDVRYMALGEGPDVRSFERKKRLLHPEYFYYNKVLLVPAQSAEIAYDDSDDDDDSNYDEMLTRLKRTPNRDVNSYIGWWIWDKGCRS